MAMNVSAQLKLSIRDFASNLTRASGMMSKFANNTNKAYGKMSKELLVHKMHLKDVSRIVQGILISQAFYRATNAIGSATSALMEFNEQLDYAQVTYSALFGDTKLAEDFIKVLQEHSINTIFEYSDLADASKKLLAYGIDYSNLMYIMKGLTDMGAMSGDAQSLERIARALGQIYTKGTLKAEEMRQLADAYVPIYEIVQQTFDLTDKQMEKVGDLKIPAYQVINAVVDYANAKFGGVAEAAMYTITGLKNRIVDTLKVLGSDMLMPFTKAFKSFLAFVDSGLAQIREAYTSGGWGGVLDKLIPDERTQAKIRLFFANFHNMLMSIMSTLQVVLQIAGTFGSVLVNAFNVLAPVIILVNNVVAAALNHFLNTAQGAYALRIALLAAAAAWAIFKTQALIAAVMTAAAKAIAFVSKTLLILSTIIANVITTMNPLIVLFVLLAAVVGAFALSSDRASTAIGNLFNKLSSFAKGVTASDILKDAAGNLNDAADAADNFNHKVGEGADALDATDDSAKKASKSLLSFDEVFKLPEKTDDSAGISADDYDFDGMMSGLKALSADLIPEIPDFSDFISEFTDKLFGGLKDSLVSKIGLALLGAALGAALMKLGGGIIAKVIEGAVNFVETPGQKFARLAGQFLTVLGKALLGAAIGYGYDAIASMIVDKLWEALEGALKLQEGSAENASLGATIGAVIGGAVGMVAGGLKGSLIGAAIGQLAGGFVGLMWEEIGGAISNTVSGALAGMGKALTLATGKTITKLVSELLATGSFSGFFSGLGQLLTKGTLKAVAKGGVIGMAIGFLVDSIASLLWDWLAEKLQLSGEATGHAKIGQTIGSIIGMVVGGIFGGPVGVMIGSAIGTFVGGFVGLISEKLVASKDAFLAPWKRLIEGVVEYFSGIGEAITSGLKEGNLLKVGASIIEGIFAGMLTAFAAIPTIALTFFQSLIEGFKDVFGIHSPAAEMMPIGEYILLGILEGFTNAIGQFLSAIGTFATDIIASIVTWLGGIATKISEWGTDTVTSFTTWAANVIASFTAWKDSVIAVVTQWASDALSAFTSWITNNAAAFMQWASDVGQRFNDFRQNAVSFVRDFVADTVSSFTGWWQKTREGFTTWATGVYDSIKDKFSSAYSKIKEFLGLNTSISSFCSSALKTIKDWAGNVWSSISSAFGNAISKIREFISASNSASKVKGSSGVSLNLGGHATGGIFTKEHIARFAEGNKAEAVIPLENASAMQPFVDAISNGIVASLAPVLATSGGSGTSDQMPVYVGTLIADDKGLKELERKLKIIRVKEEKRGG